MLKKFILVQHESLIKIKVLNCKGGTALRWYRLCFIVLCGLMDNFQHFYVTRPIWSVIMSQENFKMSIYYNRNFTVVCLNLVEKEKEGGDIGLKRERSSSLIRDNASGDAWC